MEEQTVSAFEWLCKVHWVRSVDLSWEDQEGGLQVVDMRTSPEQCNIRHSLSCDCGDSEDVMVLRVACLVRDRMQGNQKEG